MKHKLTLVVTAYKSYEIEAKDRNEAEEKAIEEFKKVYPIDINEDETYAQFEPRNK